MSTESSRYAVSATPPGYAPHSAGPVDRRGFVVRCARLGVGAGAAAAALPLAGCASLATARLTPVDGVLRLPVRNYPQLDRAGGGLRVAPEGSGRPIYVLRQEDGTYLALSSECTHLKCTVNLEGARIVCPCHGSTYDRDGHVLVGPAERPLARFPTRMRDDGVLEISL